MATKNKYISSNFTPVEPEEFVKWCVSNRIAITKTGYGKNVYITTTTPIARDNSLVRFTKCDNPTFRDVMLCEVTYKGNECMGCTFYSVTDAGIKECGRMIYPHNAMRFFRIIAEQMGETKCWDWIGKPDTD